MKNLKKGNNENETMKHDNYEKGESENHEPGKGQLWKVNWGKTNKNEMNTSYKYHFIKLKKPVEKGNPANKRRNKQLKRKHQENDNSEKEHRNKGQFRKG